MPCLELQNAILPKIFIFFICPSKFYQRYLLNIVSKILTAI